jgi:tight adherence protein C
MVVALALSLGLFMGRWRMAVVAAVGILFVVAPFAGAGVLLGAGLWMLVRRVLRPNTGEGDEALLAELAALGLTAGLTFPAAVDAATTAVPGDASDDLRRAGRRRADPANAPSDDPGLFLVARRALATGAPLAPAVAGYATALRSEERSRRLAAARRLPVKLLFPLALLILPGFLMLTVGPALLGSLERLGL